MGYFLAIAVALLGTLLIVGALFSRGRRIATGRSREGHVIEPTSPASDEPTPGASDTASARVISNAQSHVPPA